METQCSKRRQLARTRRAIQATMAQCECSLIAHVLVQYDRRARRVGMGQAACQDIGAAHAPCPSPSAAAGAGLELIEQ